MKKTFNKKIYKIIQKDNRELAKNQGFYDGRYLPKREDSKKRTQYLKFRRDKYSLKNQYR